MKTEYGTPGGFWTPWTGYADPWKMSPEDRKAFFAKLREMAKGRPFYEVDSAAILDGMVTARAKTEPV